MDSFPRWQNDAFDDNIVEPVDGDQPLALPERLVGQVRILALAEDVSDTRVVRVYHFTPELANDFSPIITEFGVFGVFLVIAYEENAAQEAQVRRY